MKTKNIFSLAALAIALAACSSENDMTTAENPLQKGKIVTLTATISADNANTRTLTDNGDGTITSKWEEGDAIRVKYQNTSNSEMQVKAVVNKVDADGNATITAELTDPQADTKVIFEYPYENKYPGNGQIGTLEEINKSYNSMRGVGTIVIKNDQATMSTGVHMNNNNSILKLKLSDGTNDITKDVTALAFDINWIENEVKREEHYSLNLSSLNDIYVAFNLPGHIDLNVKVTATTASGQYTVSKSGVRLQGGKMYTSNLVLSKEIITYQAWNPEIKAFETKEAQDFIILNDVFGAQGTVLAGGTYVVIGTMRYSGTLKFTGDTKLILCDNTDISNIAEGSACIDASGYELNIYAQRLENDPDNDIFMGGINVECADGTALKAQNLNIHGGFVTPMTKADNFAGITAGNINVYGGVFGSNSYGVNYKAIGIRFSGDFNIYGGHVSARGGAGGIQYAPEDGPSQGSGLTVYGGRVDVFSHTGGFGITAHSVTINGGSVYVNGGDDYSNPDTEDYTSAGDGMNCGIITVNGGNLTAQGGNTNNSSARGAYGIGGGTIYVNGGELYANGGAGGTYENPTPGFGINENLTPIVKDGLKIYEGSDQENMSQYTGSEFKCTTQYVTIK